MKKKRILVVALVSMIMCISSVSGWAQVRKDFKGVTLNILYPALEYDKIGFDLLIPRFEKEYGAKVHVEMVPFPKTREIQLLELSKRTGRYDLVGTDCMWIAEYVQAGYLEELTKYIQNPELYDPELCVIDDWVPRNFSGNGVINDKIYSYVLSPGMKMLALNRPMFEEKGVSYPRTYEEFRQAAEKLTDTANKKYGYICSAGRGIEFCGTWMAYLYNYGGELVDEDWNCIINGPESLGSLEFLVGLRPYTPPGTGVFGWDESITTFQAGNCAITHSWGPFNILYEDPTKSELAGKVDYILHPWGPVGRQELWGSWGLAMNVDSKNKEAAFLFLQYLTGNKFAKEWALLGGAPARHSAYTDPEVRKKWRWLGHTYEFMLQEANPDYRPRIPEWAEIMEIMSLWGNRVWVGEATPEKALAEMEKEIDTIFREVGYQDPKTAPPQHWRDLRYYDKLPSKWAGVEY